MKDKLSKIFKVIILLCMISTLASFGWAQESSSKYEEQLDFANGLFSRELYDMAINQYQRFLKEYPEGDLTDPWGPLSGSERVRRGGSWSGLADRTRAAYRYGDDPNARTIRIGLRPVRSLR